MRNVSVLLAIGVGYDGPGQILGVDESQKKNLKGWRGFLRRLKGRGMGGVQIITSDACAGLVEAAAQPLSSIAVTALRCALLPKQV